MSDHDGIVLHAAGPEGSVNWAAAAGHWVAARTAASLGLTPLAKHRVTDERARLFGAVLSERSLLPGNEAWLAPTRFVDWLLHRRTTAAPAQVPASADLTGLSHELAAKVALGGSSRLEDAMREPIASWRFDPAEAQWYEAVLHDLRDAVERGRARPDATAWT